MGALQGVTILLRVLLQSRAALAAENLALRQQLAVLQRSVKRHRLNRLGYEVGELTVAKYSVRGGKPASRIGFAAWESKRFSLHGTRLGRIRSPSA